MGNDAYQQAIIAAIANPFSAALKAAADNDNTVHANADTRPPTVYDIGAGIGLLAVMAAKAGAGHVVAVEHSKPVAALLASVVEQNGVKPIVSIVEGDAFDLPEHGLFTFKPELFAAHPNDPDPSSSSGWSQPPIIIVHELFAPHMLCEFCHGVVPAMRERLHAVRVVPARARTYAVLVDSRYLSGQGDPRTRDDRANASRDVNGVDISSVQFQMNRDTNGAAADFAFSIGSSALPSDDLVRISEPVPIIGVDFEMGAPYELQQWAEQEGAEFTVTRAGTARAVVLYWEADMLSEEGSPVLSLDPTTGEGVSLARHKAWGPVVQEALLSGAPVDETRGEWGGAVEVGDRVGFSWRHQKIAKNEDKPILGHEGCELLVTLKSHNGRAFAGTNRLDRFRQVKKERVERETEL